MDKRAVLFSTLNVLILLARPSRSAGAGRAFPVDSENFAIQSFKDVNPSVEWDPTNFLVDLSGQYANCNNLNTKGELPVDKKTQEGEKIVVVIDSIEGKESDVNSVNTYITDVIRRWERSRQYNQQIQNARRVGCSVRPSCSGQAIIACMFSGGVPSGLGDDHDLDYQLPNKPVETDDGSKDNKDKETDGGRETDTDAASGRDTYQRPDFLDEKPTALAFTVDQYKMAESIMSKTWDRLHFLENLSGFETNCSMIGTPDWPFEFAHKMMNEEKIVIKGQYGHAVNKGSTPGALSEVLATFKLVPNAKSIGCSVIPHCRVGPTMYVVVSCLYKVD